MAFVRGVIAPARRSGSRFRVPGSTSTKTGRAPACSTASAVKAAEIAGGDHLVARADAERAQGESESVGAVPDRHGVPRAERLGQLALEGLPLGAQDEPAGVEDPRHRLVELAPVRGHVGPEVHEGDGEGSAHR